jgi:hypothetical protein
MATPSPLPPLPPLPPLSPLETVAVVETVEMEPPPPTVSPSMHRPPADATAAPSKEDEAAAKAPLRPLQPLSPLETVAVAETVEMEPPPPTVSPSMHRPSKLLSRRRPADATAAPSKEDEAAAKAMAAQAEGVLQRRALPLRIPVPFKWETLRGSSVRAHLVCEAIAHTLYMNNQLPMPWGQCVRVWEQEKAAAAAAAEASGGEPARRTAAYGAARDMQKMSSGVRDLFEAVTMLFRTQRSGLVRRVALVFGPSLHRALWTVVLEFGHFDPGDNEADEDEEEDGDNSDDEDGSEESEEDS